MFLELSIIVGLLWAADLFWGRKLGGPLLKGMWLVFFAKLMVPVGLLFLSWGPSPLETLIQDQGSEPMPLPGPLEAPVGPTSPLPDLSNLPVIPGLPDAGMVAAVVAAVLVAVLLVRVLLTFVQLGNLVPIGEGSIRDTVTALATRVGLKGPVRLLWTAEGGSPASWRLWRPTVLLPRGWEDHYTAAEREQILLHELVHLKDHDSLVWLGIQILTCVYWFHPLVWVARHRVRLAQEAACDRRVLALGSGPGRHDYGRSLMKVIEMTTRAPVMGTTGAVLDKNELKRRIQMIYDERPRIRTWSRVIALSLAGLFLVGVSLVPLAALNSTPDRLRDNINLPFVDDPSVLGHWKVVDFVETPDQYVPGQTSFRGEPFLLALTFWPHGALGCQVAGNSGIPGGPVEWLSWTKGTMIQRNDETTGAYTVVRKGTKKVMFLEWKSGDYTIRHERPWYYVLEAD